ITHGHRSASIPFCKQAAAWTHKQYKEWLFLRQKTN
ncbi:unnamed protein product, partial [Brassica oleracea]